MYMSIVKNLLFVCFVSFLSFSCGKDESIDQPVVPTAVGSLRIDSTNDDCLPSSVGGIYVIDSALNASNYINVTLNITSPGAYKVQTNSVNGYSFSGSGVASATGLTNVKLLGSGKPVSAGFNIFQVTYGGTTCFIDVTVNSSVNTSAYTITCSGTKANGTYSAGTATNSANTITVPVNVTAIGNYSITTNTQNGVSFSATGTFTGTGNQNIILSAKGTPTAGGTFNYTITGGTSTCSVSITATAPSRAVYTFAGAPGACTLATVNGTYTVQTALTSSNTIITQVNVTSVGLYSITTATASGISFSATGLFTTTGTQTVTLTGSGTPTAAGTASFTPTDSAVTGCSFSVPIAAVPTQPSVFKATIGYTPAVSMDFSTNASASTSTGSLSIDGNTTSNAAFTINIAYSDTSKTFAVGTYNGNGYSGSNKYIIAIGYTDSAQNTWLTASNVTGTYPAFTINITSISATNIQGNFTGTLLDEATLSKKLTISNGTFNLPIQ